MNQSEIIEWVLITIFLFIILLILYRPTMREGLENYKYRRQTIDKNYNYMIANDKSNYLRNTDGNNNYELRLDASGLVIYQNDVSFIEIDVKNYNNFSLLYDVSNQISGKNTDTSYAFVEVSTNNPGNYIKYGETYYFKKNADQTNQINLSGITDAPLKLTPTGNLVAIKDNNLIWANGYKVDTEASMVNGQFIGNNGTYFEYIMRDNVKMFEKYKVVNGELVYQNISYDGSLNPSTVYVDTSENILDSSNIYTANWANGRNISSSMTDELKTGQLLKNGKTILQLRNNGLYLNDTPHIKFSSNFAEKMYLTDGNLIVEDNTGIIWNFDTGPGNATVLEVNNNQLYLKNNENVKWTIHPDASYNTIKDETEKKQLRQHKEMTDTHSGSDERYTNVVSNYYREMINTFNLGVGILAGTIVIFRNT